MIFSTIDCLKVTLRRLDSGCDKSSFVRSLLVSFLLVFCSSVNAQDGASSGVAVNDAGFRVRPATESEFDNKSDAFVKDWRTADPEHDDTNFGDQMYNEASTPSKLEMLRLLSKDTPSSMVFMHAVSMGLGVDEVLQAAVRYQPENGRDLAEAAVNMLPMIPETSSNLYSSYEVDDLKREDKSEPYSVLEVMERFFKERQVLRPYPDWFDGQYHFLASAAELKQLQEKKKDRKWYRSKSSASTSKRPIFVSLYEADGSVMVDGQQRIEQALAKDSDARLPVVFIFNRVNERAIDELTYVDENDKQGRDYPRTIQGIKDAYINKNLMLTPAPEWHIGEHQMQASIDEFEEIFDIPDEQDFEPQAWQKLLAEAKKYSVNDTSFLVVMFDDAGLNAKTVNSSGTRYAMWDDPRTEADFKYVAPMQGDDVIPLTRIMAKGLIFNRPDLIAALKTLGVSSVPVAFYYMDNARVKPYNKGPRALIQAAIGAGAPIGSFGDGGGFLPPAVEEVPPASPPGIQ